LAGISRILTIRPSRNVVIRSGASRKSRAERVGRGVHDDEVVVAGGLSCPSFSIAMYSCVPAKELESAW
jgi:hypothetical protein